MKRRQFLHRAAGAGAVAAAAALPAPAVASGRRELTMLTLWPRDFPGLWEGSLRLATAISEMTDGELSVKVFAPGEMVSPMDTFDAVADGRADIYHAIEYYWRAKSEAFNFFAAIPFGMTATEANAWVREGGGQELWDELSGSFGLKPFLAGNTGGQMGGWFKKEINSADDLRGLKMRMPGLAGEALEKVGGKSVSMPAGRFREAAKDGELDAVEWFGPWIDRAEGLNEIFKYYYFPSFHEPGTSLSAAVNAKLWAGLSPSQRRVIATAAEAENGRSLDIFNARNAEALDRLRFADRVPLRQFPEMVLVALGAAAGQAVDALGETGAMGRKTLDSYLGFRKKAIAWSKMSDQTFQQARLLPFKFGG